MAVTKNVNNLLWYVHKLVIMVFIDSVAVGFIGLDRAAHPFPSNSHDYK